MTDTLVTRTQPDFLGLDDGDVVDVDDRHSVQIRVGPDESWTLDDDGDWFGRVAPYQFYNREGMRAGRPSGFDGSAEVLRYGVMEPTWWMPPKDVRRDDPSFNDLRRAVVDALEFGASFVALELRELVVDSRGHEHWVCIDSESVGGVVGMTRDYLNELCNELWGELSYRLNESTSSTESVTTDTEDDLLQSSLVALFANNHKEK